MTGTAIFPPLPPMIRPSLVAGEYHQFDLTGYTKDEIEKILGFPPNINDDPFKVTSSWGFTLDGIPCGIWDYKGFEWSAFGPEELIREIFPNRSTTYNT